MGSLASEYEWKMCIRDSLQGIKFLRQGGGIALPDSVSARVLPDEVEGSLPVEAFLAPHSPSFRGEGLSFAPTAGVHAFLLRACCCCDFF